MKTELDEYNRRAVKVFTYSFLILEGIFIILALPYSEEKAFFGFGSFGGFDLVTIFSLFIAFIILLFYGMGRRAKQIDDIIEAKHQEIMKNKRK